MISRFFSCFRRPWALLLPLVLVFAGLGVPAASLAAVAGSIEGEVTATGGAPIAEVWACAYLVPSEEFEENCDFTAADGLYSIAGLEAGRYKVEFWPESTSPSYVGEFYDDKRFWEEADEVEVAPGVATTGIDAELVEGATIAGQVDAASGGPVESALVCAFLPEYLDGGCTETKSDGSYVLPGLPSGEYRVEFHPFGPYNLLPQYYDHASSPEDADPITLVAGETRSGIDADLDPGAEIRGAVYSAPTGAPLAKVLVCTLFADLDWPYRCERTSSAGTYRFGGLPSDAYKVTFSLEQRELFGGGYFDAEDDGYLPQYFDGKSTLAAADVIALAPPEVRAGIDAHLQPARTTPAQPLAVTAPAVLPKPVPHRKRLRCRPGFRKKKVGGKRRCVRAHRHRHRRGHASART